MNAITGTYFPPSLTSGPSDDYEMSADALARINSLIASRRIIRNAIKELRALPIIGTRLSLETPEELAEILADYATDDETIRREVENEDREDQRNRRDNP